MRVQQFDFSVDVMQAILWQYDKSTKFLELMQKKQDWYTLNQTEFWNNWFTNVFNLLTANTFGLSVWCFILDIPFYIDTNPEPANKPNFGFNAYDPAFPDLENTYLNFNNSNFSTIGSTLTLTVEEQRFLLRLRYYKLSCRCDVIDVNTFLNYLVSTSNINYAGTIYVLDGVGTMTQTYVFTSEDFPANLLKAIKDLDVLPRPTGVKNFYEVYSRSLFGFGEFYQNFENGNFIQTVS